MRSLIANKTSLIIGKGVVEEKLKDYVSPKSKIVLVYGSGSIFKNGAKDSVQHALDSLECESKWIGGISPNPDFNECVKIAEEVKVFSPDMLISVGGGSCLDAAKYIGLLCNLEEGKDPWRIFSHNEIPSKSIKIGGIITVPANGSEWSPFIVISRRDFNEKRHIKCDLCLPIFAFVDPNHVKTLPRKQFMNNIYDTFCHCIDQFVTPEESPIIDGYWMSLMKDLIDLGYSI